MESKYIQNGLQEIADKHNVHIKVVKNIVNNQFYYVKLFLTDKIDLYNLKILKLPKFGSILLKEVTLNKLFKKMMKEDG